AAYCRKPDPPVRGLPDSRAPPIAFAAPHALGDAVGDRQNRRDFPIGKIIEVLQTEAKDTLIGTEPEIALPVRQDALQHVVGQTFFSRDCLQLPVAQTEQSPAVSRKPVTPGRLLID